MDTVNLKSRNGETPLFVASTYGQAAVVTLLLRCGADPKATNKEGFSSIHAAARGNHPGVVKVTSSLSNDALITILKDSSRIWSNKCTA